MKSFECLKNITYPTIFQNKLVWSLWKKTMCKNGFHLFDEVLSSVEFGHFLYCDACELEIMIDDEPEHTMDYQVENEK